MSEYTPTTEVVKDASCFPRNRLGEPRGIEPEAFDRWLAGMIREAKAEGRKEAEADRDALQQQVHDVCSERVNYEAQIEAVRKYADERAWYAARNRTVGSARIASDLFQILGLGPDGKEKP